VALAFFFSICAGVSLLFPFFKDAGRLVLGRQALYNEFSSSCRLLSPLASTLYDGWSGGAQALCRLCPRLLFGYGIISRFSWRALGSTYPAPLSRFFNSKSPGLSSQHFGTRVFVFFYCRQLGLRVFPPPPLLFVLVVVSSCLNSPL